MNIKERDSEKIWCSCTKRKSCFFPDEAVKVAKELGSNVTVVKAQIHAGGRGKAGGVKSLKP